MIRTIVASRSSSRIYIRRIIRLSVTKRHGYKSNRHLADLDQIGGKFQNDFFNASISSITAYWVFSSASTRAKYFSSVSVHTRSFLRRVDFPASEVAILSLYFTARRPLALGNAILIFE